MIQSIIDSSLSFPIENISETQKTVLMQKIIDLSLYRQSNSKNLQELIKLLEQNNFTKEHIAQLKNLIIASHDELTAEKLKEVILNSGVEAKIKQTLSEVIKIEQIHQDLKAILNNKEEVLSM